MEEEYDIREGETGPDLVNVPVNKIQTIPNGKKIKENFDKGVNFDFIKTTKRDPIYFKLWDAWFKLTKSENIDSIIKRGKKVFTKIKQRHSSGDILLVSHGGFIGCFLSFLFNLTLDGMGNKFGKYKNCHISSIEVDGNKRVLELMLYSKYLDDI